jgi:hypothetical protein
VKAESKKQAQVEPHVRQDKYPARPGQGIALRLLAAIPPGTFPVTVIPLAQVMAPPGYLLVPIGAWHHGGINE